MGVPLGQSEGVGVGVGMAEVRRCAAIGGNAVRRRPAEVFEHHGAGRPLMDVDRTADGQRRADRRLHGQRDGQQPDQQPAVQ